MTVPITPIAQQPLGLETLTGFVLDDDIGTYSVWVCADHVSGEDLDRARKHLTKNKGRNVLAGSFQCLLKLPHKDVCARRRPLMANLAVRH